VGLIYYKSVLYAFSLPSLYARLFNRHAIKEAVAVIIRGVFRNEGFFPKVNHGCLGSLLIHVLKFT